MKKFITIYCCDILAPVTFQRSLIVWTVCGMINVDHGLMWIMNINVLISSLICMRGHAKHVYTCSVA